MQTPVTNDSLESLYGKKILSACSSLRNFSITFEENLGLSIDAISSPSGCAVQTRIVEANSLPTEADAVCSVDWSWIKGSAPRLVGCSSSSVKFELDPAGPLVVSVALWQGKPFLSFQPFRK
jgi:hypothetical protein